MSSTIMLYYNGFTFFFYLLENRWCDLYTVAVLGFVEASDRKSQGAQTEFVAIKLQTELNQQQQKNSIIS